MPKTIYDYEPRSGRLVKEDGTVVNEAQGVNPDGSRNVSLTGSYVRVPQDIQSHYQQAIQTHNAVSVGASGFSVATSYIDCDGFDKVAVTIINDLTSSFSVDFLWSHDGVNYHGQEAAVPTGTGLRRAGIADTKGRYLKVQLNNNDSSSTHTMSAWVMLKA